jgi:hypothetical protein
MTKALSIIRVLSSRVLLQFTVSLFSLISYLPFRLRVVYDIQRALNKKSALPILTSGATSDWLWTKEPEPGQFGRSFITIMTPYIWRRVRGSG